MTKLQFLLSLNEKLVVLPRDEAEERMRFYCEMIEDRMEDGLSEEEAVAAVGSVEEIAAATLRELTPPAQPPKKKRKLWEIWLLILGAPLWITLVAAAAVVALAGYISWWAVLVSLWAVDVSLICCALAGVLGCGLFCIQGRMASGLAVLAAGLFCAGLGIVFFFGCRALTKGTALLTKKLFTRRVRHG